jgi:predicted aspartyl protease
MIFRALPRRVFRARVALRGVSYPLRITAGKVEPEVSHWMAPLKSAPRCILAFVLAVAGVVPAFPPASNPETIPFQVNRSFGVMLIRAEVNGNPATLILDTGSNLTTISSRFVDVAIPPLRDKVSTQKGSGFSGTGVFTRASLKVGPVVWRDHRILAMDTKEISKSLGENVDGLLGMDFLNEFEIVVVDLRQHKLILR